jgi:hypothetical protein
MRHLRNPSSSNCESRAKDLPISPDLSIQLIPCASSSLPRKAILVIYQLYDGSTTEAVRLDWRGRERGVIVSLFGAGENSDGSGKRMSKFTGVYIIEVHHRRPFGLMRSDFTGMPEGAIPTDPLTGGLQGLVVPGEE